MLTFTHISLARTEQLFKYKQSGWKLDPFPGYGDDQWGIKAHNRPWIEDAGGFDKGQRILEVGGAYSLLPEYLACKYGSEAWIGDDFGGTEDPMWSRWGNPQEYAARHPAIHYVFEKFGGYNRKYPDAHFDRIFSVSTLEHIPRPARLDVLRDMNRCLKRGGRMLHTIDVGTDWRQVAVSGMVDLVPGLRHLGWKGQSELRGWIDLFRKSGVSNRLRLPSPFQLLDREVLVESPDVVFRFYPPNGEPKRYRPGASLLIVIEDL